MRHIPQATIPLAGWMTRGVKSVQANTIALSTIQTTNTATINAVDVNNSVLLLAGTDTSEINAPASSVGRLTFTNLTTITLARQDVGGGVTLTASFVVIEFYPGIVKSVQRATIALTAVATNTATITTVDTNKSAVFHLGAIVSSGVDHSEADSIAVLTNATTVTATRIAATNNVTMGFQVVEFY